MRHHEARRSGDARPLEPPDAGADGARLAPSLRALLSTRGLAPETCRLTVRGTDPEGLVVVDVESEGRSLSLRLRPGGDEVVRGVEASPPALSSPEAQAFGPSLASLESACKTPLGRDPRGVDSRPPGAFFATSAGGRGDACVLGL